MKKIAALLMCAVITALSVTMLLTGCSDFGSTNNDADEIDITKLPGKFDLRNVDGKNYVTPVKSQNWGDCWSFALAGAAETAYLYSNEMGVPAGESNRQVDFSEKYVAWYTFHGITKDDVAQGKVRASQVGEGFDLGKLDKDNSMNAYFIGGPFIHSSNLFGSGFGPVDESTQVKGELPYAYNDEASVEWALPLNAEYRNAPVAALFRDSRALPVPASFDEAGNYRFNEEGINAIKSELYQGHGVTVSLNVMNGGFNNKNHAAYYSGNEAPDHAVTVVGYDDDYPKENFTKNSADEEKAKSSTPPENGALIIKNSWGLQKADGDIDDGYVYVSYYDHCLLTALSYVFDNSKEAKSTSPAIDQYDLMMTQWYGVTEYDDETKIANVFDAEDDESLYQIEYRTAFPDAEVKYEVYRDVEDNDPSFGTLLEKGVCSHKYAGSHVKDLKKEYALKKGDKYSVVLTMKRGEKYTEVFPYSTSFFDGMTVKGIVNEGESFLYKDGGWTDMTERKESLLERAKKQCAENLDADKSSPELSLKGKEFAVDNYPIKAILTTDKHK